MSSFIVVFVGPMAGVFKSLLENSMPPNKFFGEFLIDSRAVAPCFRPIEIIVELVKTGDLSRLEGRVRNQSSFQDPERSSS